MRKETRSLKFSNIPTIFSRSKTQIGIRMDFSEEDIKSMKYSYLHCLSTIIHPRVEIENITQLNNIRKHFHRVILESIDIKPQKKSIERIIDSMFARWYFSQFTQDRCEKNYYIPYNASNYSTLYEDIEYQQGFVDIDLVETIIEKLNMSELCNLAIENVQKFIDINKYEDLPPHSTNSQKKFEYKIYKKFIGKNVRFTLHIEDFSIPKNIRSFILPKSTYESLKRSYNKFSDKIVGVDILIWCLVARYISLNIYNLQLAIPKSLYKKLQDELELNFETFASGLNKFFNHYCSIFGDIETHFGSRGSFFSFKPLEGIYSVNPPFDSFIINKTTDKLLEFLDNSSGKLGFFITIPVWDKESLVKLKNQSEEKVFIPNHHTPFPAVKRMIESKYLKYHRIFHKNHFPYYDYTSGKTKYVANTHVFILGNDDLEINPDIIDVILSV